MPRSRLRHYLLLLLAGLLVPSTAKAQGEDTLVWQSTGRESFITWACMDSATARSLIANLRHHDFRFLNVPDYGDGAIGMYTPAHDSAMARYGVRMYRTSPSSAGRACHEKYYKPYHFAEYYNRTLFAFLSAPDSLRECFLSQVDAASQCSWSPLPPANLPPPERPLVQASASETVAMLDAVLATALARVGTGTPIALDADLGWDGVYSLARKGQHPREWLATVLARHQVTCLKHWAGSSCPTRGALTTIELNEPRIAGVSDTVVTTSIRTVVHQEWTKNCGWGCFFGEDYDAHLASDSTGWHATVRGVGYLN